MPKPLKRPTDVVQRGKLIGDILAGQVEDKAPEPDRKPIDAATGQETMVYSFCSKQDCRDGAYPYAAMFKLKHALFDTTFSGGAHGGAGTVFKLEP